MRSTAFRIPQRRVTRFVGTSTRRRRGVVQYRVGQRVVVRRALLRRRSSLQRMVCALPQSQPMDSDQCHSIPRLESDRKYFGTSNRLFLLTRTIVDPPQACASVVPWTCSSWPVHAKHKPYTSSPSFRRVPVERGVSSHRTSHGRCRRSSTHVDEDARKLAARRTTCMVS